MEFLRGDVARGSLQPPRLPSGGLVKKQFAFFAVAILFVATFVTSALTAAATASAAEMPRVVPVEGEPFSGQLTAVDAAWRITFAVDGQSRTLPAADLLAWGKCPEAARRPLVMLADGGLLVADVHQMDKDSLLVDCDLFGSVKLPLELLAGVVFQTPAELRRCDRLLDRIDSASGDADRLILANDDELSGRVEAIQKGVIQFRTDAGPVPVEIRRTRALIFNPSLISRPTAKGIRAWTGFADGSRLLATQLVMDERSLKITAAGGLGWNTASRQLTWLAPQGAGRVVYLSDLKPDSYRHVPFLELSWPYRMDRSVSGRWLRSGANLYLKGIGVHSASRLTYRLSEPYRRFQAELAIDDETAGRGSVRFRVFLDGSMKYESPMVTGDVPPVPVSLDVTGVKRLDLIVDYADRADEMDRADWLNARLVR